MHSTSKATPRVYNTLHCTSRTSLSAKIPVGRANKTAHKNGRAKMCITRILHSAGFDNSLVQRERRWPGMGSCRALVLILWAAVSRALQRALQCPWATSDRHTNARYRLDGSGSRGSACTSQCAICTTTLLFWEVDGEWYACT